MTFIERQYRKRLSLGVGLAILIAYYLLVFRPLVQEERAKIEPFEDIQAELAKIAEYNPAISGLSLKALNEIETKLRQSLINSAEARNLINERYAPEPAIATNLARAWQLIDYQNERSKRSAALGSLAQAKNVKILPAVTAGLPELTADTERGRENLLWAQLGLVDAVLKTAVEAGVTSLDSVLVPEPIIYPASNKSGTQLIEIPIRVEVSGNWEEMTRTLGALLLEETDRKKLGLPDLEGLPGMSLRHIVARKSPPEGPSTIQLEVEFSGFISVPVIKPSSLINLDN